MITKTQKAIDLVNKSEYNKALTIVSKFRRLSVEEKQVFGDAQSAVTNPRFYAQIKSEQWVANAVTAGYQLLHVWAKTNTKKAVV